MAEDEGRKEDEAMVEDSGPENNGYSVMEITKDGTILLSGFRKQNEYHWKK